MDVTFRVSPWTSPLTLTRKWSFFVEALRAAVISLLPAESNLRNFLSSVMMP